MTSHVGAPGLFTQVLAPQLIDQSAANTLSSGVDMQGYDRVRFIYDLGAVVNGGTLSTWAVESDESNLGNSVNLSWDNNGSNALISLTNVANTGNNNVYVLDIYRPTKRYVGVYVDAVSQNITSLSVIAEQFRGSGVVPPASAATEYVSKQAVKSS